jgi:pimeloyl-ACP methyl ester carboxylesterase
VRAGAIRLHVAELGPPEAPPLLLVHGWPQHWWCWRRVAPELARDFRCVMADLRGHGWSEAPATGYEKERLAGDLLALLDALEIERAGWVGHDWGAFAGLLAALRAPERFTGLLALSVGHPWPSRHDRLSPLRLAAFVYQLPLSSRRLVGRLLPAGLIRRALAGGARDGTFSPADLELYDAVLRSPERAHVTSAMYWTFVRRELPAIVRGRYAGAHLRVPTRLVVGEQDPPMRGSDLLGYEDHADDMTHERVPGVRHFLPEEAPQVVVARARELFG